MRFETPRFSIASLIVAMISVAIGVAIIVAPTKGATTLTILSGSSRAAQGLQWMAVLWLLIEMVQQAIAIHRRSKGIRNEFFFGNLMGLVERIWLSGMLFVLLTVKILLLRGIIAYPKTKEFLPVGMQLWPNVLLSFTLLACLLTLYPRATKPYRLRVISFFVNAIVILGTLLIGFYIVTEQQFVAALVHIAIAGINISSPISIRRVGVFPNHQFEGYRTFWIAASAACLVIIGGVLLLLHAKSKLPIVRRTLSNSFFTIVILLGIYVGWFKLFEFPRINPDMASVGWAALWPDFVAGAVLLLSLAYAMAWSLTKLRVQTNEEQIVAPNKSKLAIMSVIGIVVSEVCSFADGVRQTLSISLLFSNPSQALLVALETVGYLFLTPSTLMSMLLIAKGTSVLWRVMRHRAHAHGLTAIDGRDFLSYIFAVIMLLMVAIPTFAAFGFCWWLGPFI